MRSGSARARLVLQLQRAYSGEQAAAYAYRGHWASLRDPDQRERVCRIEAEEWHHRELIGDMLRALGSAPDAGREMRTLIIGRVLGALCHVCGWFLPMYGAGRLERNNIQEYVDAAAHASAAGHPELVDCLLTMAEVEWDHEAWFRKKASQHWLGRIVPIWNPRPPRHELREGTWPPAGSPEEPD